MKRWLYIFFLLLIAQSLFSQTQIEGRVIDSATGKSLLGVSIYINGSISGTTSDDNGRFYLNIPKGLQLLVFSSIGFKVFTITTAPGNDYSNLLVKMNRLETELETVVVQSTKYKIVNTKFWKDKFIEYFIGTGEQAKYCIIKNFSDLILKASKDSSILKAQSKQPIEIINKWLGYKLYFNIEESYANFNANAIINYGFTRFEDIGGNDKRYEQRRKDLYLGSLIHFVKALCNNNLQSQGFFMQRAKRDTNYERIRIINLMNNKENNINFSKKNETLQIGNCGLDSSKYYYDVYANQKNLIITYGNSSLNLDSIMATDLETVKEIYFKEYIAITYNSIEMVQNNLNKESSTKQVSFLSLHDDNSIFIFPNGRLTPPKELLIEGHWKESNCIKNMMPYDYN